jgi:3-hydroxymyristoyl/3-hydroxydecanoyl-(acyl carrier protein) dehydratase
LLIAFSAPVSPGVSFMKTFWQMSHVAGNSVTPIVATTAYTAQFGSIIAGTKIFLKVTPVNQYGVTGTPNIVTAIVS